MRKSIFTLVAIIAAYSQAMAWGYHGHATIAYIAEQHLTPKAKANIEKCIEGRSIVYYASWLDNHRKEHKEWDRLRHTCDFDFETGKLYGDPVRQMNETINLLKDYENLADSVRKVRIYHFVHSFGDYHCPGHVAFYDCKGEKPKRLITSSYDFYLKTKKTRMQYHKLWDAGIVQMGQPGWGYMDWGHALDSSISQEYIDSITAGSLKDWMRDIATKTQKEYRIYDKVPAKDKEAADNELSVVDGDMMNEFYEIAAKQILIGGLRMAKVINEIFGE
jgi:hypothetical protein